MKLSANQIYKHKEIRVLLKICPVCSASDEVALWSTMTDLSTANGREGIDCVRCSLELVFSFKLDEHGEIVDAYTLEHFKIGNLEFKNNDKQLVLYLNNTYVKDIDTNSVDLAKCKNLVLLS